jgi:amidase
LLDVTAGPMPGDPYFAPPPDRPWAAQAGEAPGRLRVGFMRDAPRDLEIDPECRAAVDGAARALEALGHHVEEAHPEALADPGCVANYVRVVTANTARALESVGARIGRELGADDVEPLTWALAGQGRALSATGLLETLEFVHGFGRRVASWWHDEGFDLLLTPTQGAVPAPLGHISSTAEEPFRAFVRAAPYGVFTLPFNLTGQPAISLPLHWTPDGLPLGVQLVAASAREDLLLRVAAQLENAHPWADRWPDTSAVTVG